jgi:RecB family exonuclease
LRFLTPDVVIGRAVPSDKMLAKARERLRTAADGIRAGDFTANPTYQACEYCPYAGICPDRV